MPAVVAVLIAFDCSFLLGLFQAWQDERSRFAENLRHYALASQCSAISALYKDAGIAVGAYSMNKNPDFLARLEKISKQIPEDIAELKELTKGHPEESEIVVRIEAVCQNSLAVLDEASGIVDGKKPVAPGKVHQLYVSLRKSTDILNDEFQGLCPVTRRIESSSGQSVVALLTVGLATNCLALLALVAHIFSLRRSK